MHAWDDFLSANTHGHRVTEGNHLTHLRDDDRAVRTIWQALETARHRIWMSMFRLEPDPVGGATLERLTEAARRGCEVLLIYDDLGSMQLRERDLTPLRAAGGTAVAFNRVWPPWKREGRLLIRNHRKLILVDDTRAFCGGMNLSAAYASIHVGSGSALVFDDTVVRVEGPCVGDLAAAFLHTWQAITGETRPAPARPAPLPGGARVGVLEMDPRRPQTHLRQTLDDAISRARLRCRIATPYFIPPAWLTASLLDAARRGADVRVLTAGRTDVALARAAARACYGPLLAGGVRIFELFGRVLHSKTVTVDGAFGTIGSYNLDLWTSRHVLDLNVTALDAGLAASLEAEFDTFLQDASEYTMRDYEKRGLPTRLMQNLSLQISRRV